VRYSFFEITKISLNICSFIFSFLGRLDGVREGTLIAALLIVRTMRFFEKTFKKQFKALVDFIEK